MQLAACDQHIRAKVTGATLGAIVVGYSLIAVAGALRHAL